MRIFREERWPLGLDPKGISYEDRTWEGLGAPEVCDLYNASIALITPVRSYLEWVEEINKSPAVRRAHVGWSLGDYTTQIGAGQK
jgi:hypothetical protein